MLDDRRLAELMDSALGEDRETLLAMLQEMGPEDVAYFRGYVNGYSTAFRHLQRAEVEDAEADGL